MIIHHLLNGMILQVPETLQDVVDLTEPHFIRCLLAAKVGPPKIPGNEVRGYKLIYSTFRGDKTPSCPCGMRPFFFEASSIPFITSRSPSFGKGDDIKEKWMLKRWWIWKGKRFFEGFWWAFSSLRKSFRRDTIIYKIDTWGSQVVKMPSIEPLTKGTLGGGLWPTTAVCWGIKPNPQNVPDLFDRKVRTKTAGMFLFGSLVFS